MEIKDVEKLNICRSVIDATRNFNKNRSDWLTITPDEYYLDVKGTLEIDRIDLISKMNDVLKEQGFIDENGNGSVSIFGKWNDEMNDIEYKRCYPISGFCDWCGENELKNQYCVKKYGLTACTSRQRGDVADDAIYWHTKISKFDNKSGRIIGDKRYASCPDTHGFYRLISEEREPLFDIYWTV